MSTSPTADSSHFTDHENDDDCLTGLRPGTVLGPRVPGVKVDPVDVEAGLRVLRTLGYTAPHTVMVIEFALNRWARGEESAAEKGAIDLSFHGIDFTSWRQVLAAAIAAGSRKHQPPAGEETSR